MKHPRAAATAPSERPSSGRRRAAPPRLSKHAVAAATNLLRIVAGHLQAIGVSREDLVRELAYVLGAVEAGRAVTPRPRVTYAVYQRLLEAMRDWSTNPRYLDPLGEMRPLPEAAPTGEPSVRELVEKHVGPRRTAAALALLQRLGSHRIDAHGMWHPRMGRTLSVRGDAEVGFERATRLLEGWLQTLAHNQGQPAPELQLLEKEATTDRLPSAFAHSFSRWAQEAVRPVLIDADDWMARHEGAERSTVDVGLAAFAFAIPRESLDEDEVSGEADRPEPAARRRA